MWLLDGRDDHCGGSRELLSKRGFWAGIGPKQARHAPPVCQTQPPGCPGRVHTRRGSVSEVRKWGFLKTDKSETRTHSRSQPTTRHRPRIEMRSCALPINSGTGRLFRCLTASAARSLGPRFCTATCALSWSAPKFHRNDPDLRLGDRPSSHQCRQVLVHVPVLWLARCASSAPLLL